MNKKQALETLHDLYMTAIRNKRVFESFGIDQAIKAIRDMPDDNPWIPIKERTPEVEPLRVWVTVKYPSGVHTKFAIWSLEVFWSTNGRLIKEPVLAWKPYSVPEPYKEVSEEC